MIVALKKLAVTAYWKTYFQYAVFGAILMIVVVHPVLEWIHRLRSNLSLSVSWRELLLLPLLNAFNESMWPMTLVLGLLGVGIGLAFAMLHLRKIQSSLPKTTIPQGAAELRALIETGEGEELEFKTSLRWDRKLGKVNKVLEAVIAKTLAGLMNHQGGTLLIGVEDDGNIAGIEEDWNTLKHQNWDGFEQRIVTLVTSQLGGQHTNRAQCNQLVIDKKAVAVIRVTATIVPVFCKDGNVQKYYLRAGNTTRELDSYEAIAHVEEKRKRR
ncbi:AlbA family DNA-binding domain-containing protein [Coraliomargarita sp. W4R72]